VPAAERGTQLLLDTLERCTTGLLTVAVERDIADPTGLLRELDALAEAATTVRVVGAVERETTVCGSAETTPGNGLDGGQAAPYRRVRDRLRLLRLTAAGREVASHRGRGDWLDVPTGVPPEGFRFTRSALDLGALLDPSPTWTSERHRRRAAATARLRSIVRAPRRTRSR
jgi:hypothetical protein